jgi:dienelactone hydrolase
MRLQNTEELEKSMAWNNHLRPSDRFLIILCSFLLSAVLLSGCSSGPDPDDHFYLDPWPYYLYLPEGYTSERSWPLFIGVNGTADNGRDCWNTWQRYADERGFVLLCPQLADPSGLLHLLRGNERLQNTINHIYAEHSIAPQIFITGFSAGGQFVHGYVFENPSYIVGVSVMAPGNAYQPTTAASHIPFVVIVGERDDPGNVEMAQQLAAMLESSGYSVDFHVLPGVGHRISSGAIEATLELYDRVIGDP